VSDWLSRALCARTGTDPELFTPTIPDQVPEEARRICARCPVRQECDEDAWKHRPDLGIRAGIPPPGRTGPVPTKICRCGLRAARRTGLCYACHPRGARR